MTTILTIRNETTGSILMCSDSQVTSGNLKLPLSYEKILIVGDLLLGGSGSISEIQYLSKEIKRIIQIKKINADIENIYPTIEEFEDELSSFLFQVSFSTTIKDFESDFLVGGFSEIKNKNLIYNIGSDGSSIEIPHFFAIGSGSELGLSQLQNLYENNFEEKLNDYELSKLLRNILLSVSKLDIFTNAKFRVFGIDNQGHTFKMDFDNNKQQSQKKTERRKKNGKKRATKRNK